eukprot:365682-Chlamydomonas_euryale.AAC.26
MGTQGMPYQRHSAHGHTWAHRACLTSDVCTIAAGPSDQLLVRRSAELSTSPAEIASAAFASARMRCSSLPAEQAAHTCVKGLNRRLRVGPVHIRAEGGRERGEGNRRTSRPVCMVLEGGWEGRDVSRLLCGYAIAGRHTG